MLIHLSLFCFGVTAGILIQFLLVTLPALRAATRWQNLAASSLEIAEKVLKYTEQFKGFHPAEFQVPLSGDPEEDDYDGEDSEEDWEQHVDEGFLDDEVVLLPYTQHKEEPPEEDIDTLI